ncbi:PAS domain S-box protein, partial [Bacteroidota bacterium]
MNKLDISVLLVEDDRLSIVLYSSFLSKIVEKVYLAKNGIEGIEKFNEFGPDLVLSDIKMPKMDGLEMAKKIREIDDSVKIILVSGHQETDYFIKSIELGIAGYLLKPIEQEKLVKIIYDIGTNILLNKKIKETENKFRDLAELLPEIVFEADLEGRFTFINKKAHKILGYSDNEIKKGLTIHKVILPELESMESMDKLLKAFDTDLIDNEIEIRVRTKKGRTFPALMYASPIIESKRPVGIRGVMVNINKQKKIEYELRRNQQTIERILQSSPDPIIVTDMNYKIVKYNNVAKTIFSSTVSDEPLGKSLMGYIVESQKERAFNDYKIVKKKDYLKNLEYSFLDNNGNEIFTEISVSVIKDQEGNPDLIVSIIKDITERKMMIRQLQLLNLDLESKVKDRTRLLTSEIEERKQAELSLIESQERHLALSNATFETILMVENQVCLESNQAAAEMFGYSNEEFLGLNIYDLISKNYHNVIQKVLKDDMSQALEVIALTKEKKKFNAEIQWKKYRYKGKEVYILAIRDISMRKYAEKLLKQRMSFIELINKTSSEFIRLDNTKIDQGINTTLEDVCKFTKADRAFVYLLNFDNNAFEITHEYHNKNVSSRIEVIPKFSNYSIKQAYSLLKKGDSILYRKANLSQYFKGKEIANKLLDFKFDSSLIFPMLIGNTLIGFYGFDTIKASFDWDKEKINAYEITGQIIANAIQRKNYDEQIIKAKEQAEESDKSKSAFLANVSHEIQTPIKAMISFSNMIQSPDLSAKRKDEFFNIINSNSQALLNLTNDILEFTKIQSNIIKLLKINFDINLFLDEMFMLFNSLKLKKGKEEIELKLLVPDPDNQFIIHSDPSRLKQIFTNLIGNSFKFTSKGFVEYGYEIISNNTLRFFVKDSGIGISKKYQKLIFDRFIQEPKPLNFKKEGTGLGLAITHSLVKLLGGKIWVDSDL